MKYEIKPNFFIVGAAKSATTSLFFYLNQHSDIFFSEHKEPWYFSYGYCESPSEINTLDKYLYLFKNRKSESIIGEASVSYLCFKDVPKRIKAFSEDSKILISLRNPVDRAFSYYSMYKMKNLIEKDFEYYINNGLNISGIEVFSSGLYYQQVKDYLEVFGGENIKIVFYEDIISNTDSVLRSICEFLDVDSTFDFITKKKFNETFEPKYKSISKFMYSKNVFKDIIKFFIPKKIRFRLLMFIQSVNRKSKPTIEQSEKKLLSNYYKDDIIKLSDLLNVDLSHWLN